MISVQTVLKTFQFLVLLAPFASNDFKFYSIYRNICSSAVLGLITLLHNMSNATTLCGETKQIPCFIGSIYSKWLQVLFDLQIHLLKCCFRVDNITFDMCSPAVLCFGLFRSKSQTENVADLLEIGKEKKDWLYHWHVPWIGTPHWSIFWSVTLTWADLFEHTQTGYIGVTQRFQKPRCHIQFEGYHQVPTPQYGLYFIPLVTMKMLPMSMQNFLQ